MTTTRNRTTSGRQLLRAVMSGLVLCLVLAACGGDKDDADDDPSAKKGPDVTATGSPVSPQPVKRDLTAARSDTREDSVYPEKGDPLVDSLHYQLNLAWNPAKDELVGAQTLTFRATEAADTIPLDFSDALRITDLTVDGADTDFEHHGKDLRIAYTVEKDQTYEIGLRYRGTPEPTDAPSQRPDFATGLGWHVTDEHETWTLQEPFGAFTWYAVNDQPADKAYYDFTLTTTDGMAGVANGTLTDSTNDNGLSINTWRLDEPASSYLITVAFGDFDHTDSTSKSGIPVQIWADPDGDPTPGDTEYAAEAIDWLEEYLGPYPFDSFGIVVVDNESGMETQTMVTLGDTEYSLSGAVVVHEAAHQWYGDTVSPADWSDVWMNEGMVMYLQAMWEAEQDGEPVSKVMDDYALYDQQLRDGAGPPADYKPSHFGDTNIYFSPALMWHELREKIGDKSFFSMMRAWPESQRNGNSDREEYWAWLEKETGEELSAFFDAWLLGSKTPPR